MTREQAEQYLVNHLHDLDGIPKEVVELLEPLFDVEVDDVIERKNVECLDEQRRSYRVTDVPPKSG